MGDESDNHPRQCTIRKWPDFQGYGFNLHAEKGRAGQYIGKVDADSPAQAAGMKEGDRIVEVMGVNIGNENHSQVVGRIKAAGESVTMLLVDSDTDRYFKEQKIVVSSDMEEGVVLELSTPPRPGQQVEDDDDIPPPPPDNDPPEEPPSYNDVQKDDDDYPPPEREPSPEPEREPSPEPIREPSPEPEREPSPEPERAPTPEPVPIITSLPSHNYYPRLCHVIKWPDFQGYGFNLHGEKDVQGQFIGLVDADSPAEQAGLKQGDRIVEVNGDNTDSSTHQDVIRKIKEGGSQTTLLVVDKEADDYYKNNGIQITSSLPEVKRISAQPRDGSSALTPSPEPRLCHIVKWPDFNGYGFNLHAEKERGGQYIGKIDDNSPAQDGGLKERDRIIEVNGENVEDKTHREVIGKIKEGGDETRLLVVDVKADEHYKSLGMTVTATMEGVKRLQTSSRGPVSSGVTNGDSQPTRTASKRHAPSPPSSPEELVLTMSAVEMRHHIRQSRDNDKRVNRTSIRERLEIFERL